MAVMPVFMRRIVLLQLRSNLKTRDAPEAYSFVIRRSPGTGTESGAERRQAQTAGLNAPPVLLDQVHGTPGGQHPDAVRAPSDGLEPGVGQPRDRRRHRPRP